MPFETPTLPALVARADADLGLQAETGLRRSDQQVLARVHGGTAYGLYGYLGWQSRQILPDTCDEEVLARWAAMRGVIRTPATSAVGAATLRAAPGAQLDAGALLQAADGRQYATVAAIVFNQASQAVEVRAVVPGALGNAAPGTPLSLVSPTVGVLDQAVVAAGGLTAGTDEETVDAWRARVIRSMQRIPHGGDADDYEDWAMEVAGVTRAWTRANYLGPGTVGLFFMRDNDPNPIPSADAIAAVQAYLGAKRPITAELYVLAPTPLPVAYRLKVEPDSAVLRARVEQSLRALHLREADLGARFVWTHIGQAISETEGEADHRLELPAADVVPAPNELPVFGGIEWL